MTSIALGVNIYTGLRNVLLGAGLPPVVRPILDAAPTIGGDGTEGTDFTATGDTWTLDGAAATVTAREYRLVFNSSTVVAGLSIPIGTGNQSYALQMRAQVGGVWSSWATVDSGTVISAVVEQIIYAAGIYAEGIYA